MHRFCSGESAGFIRDKISTLYRNGASIQDADARHINSRYCITNMSLARTWMLAVGNLPEDCLLHEGTESLRHAGCGRRGA